MEPRKRDFRLPRCEHFINIDGFSLVVVVVVALHSAGHKIVGRLAADELLSNGSYRKLLRFLWPRLPGWAGSAC